MRRLVVIGIGQQLRGDDAAGVRVVQDWAARYPERQASPQVDVVLSPLPGLGLLDQLSGYEGAILVDAVLGGPGVLPGSLLFLEPHDLASFERGTPSAHGWGVAETLRLAQTIGETGLPEKITLLGIGGLQVGIGQEISSEVLAAIPKAAEALDTMIAEFLAES